MPHIRRGSNRAGPLDRNQKAEKMFLPKGRNITTEPETVKSLGYLKYFKIFEYLGLEIFNCFL